MVLPQTGHFRPKFLVSFRIYIKSTHDEGATRSRGGKQYLRTKFVRAETDERQREGRRQQRIIRYQMVQECKAHGMSIRRIAKLLGLARPTVRKFYTADAYPDTKRRNSKPNILDPYLPYLEERVRDGCTNAKQSWREIVAQGYRGSSSQVSKWMTWRRRQGAEGPSESPVSVHTSGHTVLPSRQTLCRILFTDAGSLDTHDSILLQLAMQNPSIAAVLATVCGLRTMITAKEAAGFDDWMSSCLASGVPAIQRFAKHLRQDRPAVLAAISTRWSNGQTEGQVNRLKMLKRQMYGRTNLDLLRARVLYCVDTT